ncbi:MAG TPA: cyclase family protein [Acidimicrobiales bacterium]|nr:cyclase family protein [Acidimicrobiales bacterium]
MGRGFRDLGAQLSNWGRFGPDDERGTLNHITAEAIAAAAASVRDGKVFELAIPIDSTTPQPGNLRAAPVHLMSETGEGQDFRGGFRYADDYVFMALQAATQWDALCHVWYDERLYNGFEAAETSVRGARRCSIDKLTGGVVGRGVLLDAPRHLGLAWLERGQQIGPAELDAMVAAQDVELVAGDVLLLRTGWWLRYCTEGATKEVMSGEPGLSLEAATWLAEHRIAAVAADNYAVEAIPPEDRSAVLALHLVLIRDLGMTLGEMFDLEELAADCAADGRWSFLLCAARLPFSGAAGSPTAPLALK